MNTTAAVHTLSARHLSEGMMMADPAGSYRIERVQHDNNRADVSFEAFTVDAPFRGYSWVLGHDEFFNLVECEVPAGFEGISRDWRNGLTEFCSVGYDYDAGEWGTLEGRTLSGVGMERTDEPIIRVRYVRHEDSRVAASFSEANGYR